MPKVYVLRVLLGFTLLSAGVLAGCPAGDLLLSPNTFAFTQGEQSKQMYISYTGWGSAEWSVKTTPAWLTVEPSQGTADKNASSVTLTANLDGIQPGDYPDQLVITQGSIEHKVFVAVHIPGADSGTGTPVSSKLLVTPASLDFGYSTSRLPVTLENDGPNDITWSTTGTLPTGYALEEHVVLTATGQIPDVPKAVTSGKLTAGQKETLDVVFDRTLAQGTYAGSIVIDSGGGRQTVSVTAAIQKVFAEPRSLDFADVAEELQFMITNQGSVAVTWSLAADTLPVWATVAPTSGTVGANGNATVKIAVDRAKLSGSQQTATVRLSTSGGDVFINMAIKGPQPQLLLVPVDPEVLEFGSQETTQSLQLSNIGTGTLAWTVEEGTWNSATQTWASQSVAWLKTNLPSGSIEAHDRITLQVNVDRLAVSAPQNDPFVAWLRFVSNDVQGTTKVIQVRMNVFPPAIATNTKLIDFADTYVEQQLAIWNSGIGTLNWTLQTPGKPSWVSFDTTSGSVSGSETDGIKFTVDRSGLARTPLGYTWTFTVVATSSGAGASGTPAAVTVGVRVVLPSIADIAVSTIQSETDNEHVDETGIAFIPMTEASTRASFTIFNNGDALLSWSIDADNAAPTTAAWLTSLSPTAGTVEPGESMPVQIGITPPTTGGSYKHTLIIKSNDLDTPELPVRLELIVPLKLSIGVRPAEIQLGPYDSSTTFEVANKGDPDTILKFGLRGNKSWLKMYPVEGISRGKMPEAEDYDWQSIGLSVIRDLLDGAGGTATIDVFALDDQGQPVPTEKVEWKSIEISVQAAELSFEGAIPRLRAPSLVRHIFTMRDIRYAALPFTKDVIGDYAQYFTITEKDRRLDADETGIFLTTWASSLTASGAQVSTKVLIMLDYSNSMFEAIKTMKDLPAGVSASADPLQALYESVVTNFVSEIPSHWRVGLTAFNDRVGGVRILTDGNDAFFTRDKNRVLNRLASFQTLEHGATELLPAVSASGRLLTGEDDPSILATIYDDASEVLAMGKPGTDYLNQFDDADVKAIVCITDGRMTTPPGKITETADYLKALRVRFYGLGWGHDVLQEPLLRLASLTGGHYYWTEETVENALTTEEISYPAYSQLFEWLSSSDTYADFPGRDPALDKKSIGNDLASQVVLSYPSLTEDIGVTARIEATFMNPYDTVTVNPKPIYGFFTVDKMDLLSIADNVRNAQVSLRSEGVNTNGQTTVTVYADYVPRGVGAMQFSMRFPYNAEVALAPADDAGIVSDWTLAPSGALLASPDADTDFTIDIPGTTNTYLKYGSFGPLFTLSFTVPGGAPAPHVNLTAVTMRNDIAGTNTFPVTYPRVLFIEPRADSYGPSLPTPRVKFIDPDTAGLKLDIANAPGQVATARFWNPGGGELMLKFPLSDPTTSLLGTSAAYVAVDGVVKADDTEFVAYLNDNSQAVDFDIVLNQTKLQPGQTTAQISIPYSYYISGGGGLTSSSRTGSITLQFLVR